MGKYYTSTKGVLSWKELLADPEKHWKPGYSAYELAYSWEDANNLPACVEKAFKGSNIPLFQNVKVLYGFPEYPVSLPGRGKSSQNDLYVLAKANDEFLTIMVEGKVSEEFDVKVEDWIRDSSEGKKNRLNYLVGLLNLEEKDILQIRYQLLHRAASAVKEAIDVNAKNAMMLIHSFSEEGKWFNDYAHFVNLFNLDPKKDGVVGPVAVSGVNLYFGWVTGTRVLSKEHYFNFFKTEKARMLAKEIDEYINDQSPYKDEVEDYHSRSNNGVRTDCIGYVSKRGSYKFATLSTARKVVFILHLGKKLHTETAKKMQRVIDELLGHIYEETDKGLTPGEVYIRLEWVDHLDQITSYIDKAYEMRLQK